MHKSPHVSTLCSYQTCLQLNACPRADGPVLPHIPPPSWTLSLSLSLSFSLALALALALPLSLSLSLPLSLHSLSRTLKHTSGLKVPETQVGGSVEPQEGISRGAITAAAVALGSGLAAFAIEQVDGIVCNVFALCMCSCVFLCVRTQYKGELQMILDILVAAAMR